MLIGLALLITYSGDHEEIGNLELLLYHVCSPAPGAPLRTHVVVFLCAMTSRNASVNTHAHPVPELWASPRVGLRLAVALLALDITG